MTFVPVMGFWGWLIISLILLGGAGYLLKLKTSRSHWRLLAIVALIVLAAARPGIPGAGGRTEVAEIDVFFVVDTTASIGALDFDGNKQRIEGVRADINGIAEKLAGSRYSMITFDGSSQVVLPLTQDSTALKTITQILHPQSTLNAKGSSITVARDTLAKRLEASKKVHPERMRLVFYFGDGENTAAAAPEPFNIQKGLISGGAVLGYGTTSGGYMFDYNYGKTDNPEYIKDTSGNKAKSVMDPKALQEIGKQLNLPYAHRQNPNGLEQDVGSALNKAKSAASKMGGVLPGVGRTDLYWIPVLGALGLMVWELIDQGRKLRLLNQLNRKGGNS